MKNHQLVSGQQVFGGEKEREKPHEIRVGTWLTSRRYQLGETLSRLLDKLACNAPTDQISFFSVYIVPLAQHCDLYFGILIGDVAIVLGDPESIWGIDQSRQDSTRLV